MIALANSATLGTSAFVQFAGLDEVDLLAISGSPSPATLAPFQERGVAVDVG